MKSRRVAGRFALAATALLAVGLPLASPRDAHAQAGKKDPGNGTAVTEEIALAVGETKTISAAGVKEYSEGLKGIAEVVPTPDGRYFIISGKKPGATNLLLIRNDGTQTRYEIAVASRNPELVEKEVQKLLEGVIGVRTRRVGSRIFIEGGVSTEGDLKRVQQVASIYGGQVDSLVVIGAPGDRKLLIRLDFFYVQYEKNSGYTVGVAWPTSVGGAGQGGQQIVNTNYTYDFISRTTTTANASIVNQPLPRLDIASRYGWAKVLKQSSLITSNGNEATYQNGGEQNFLQNVGLSVGLVKVNYGTNVTVLPRFDSNTKDVEIKLSADVADLTPSAATGGPPGRNTTKLDTFVTLKLGQALVLSGIRTATQRRNIGGLPGLSEIPVLGLLFGSHSQDKLETEGAIFIVPSVVDTVPKSSLELINNAMAGYKEYTGDIDYVDSYPRTPPNAK